MDGWNRLKANTQCLFEGSLKSKYLFLYFFMSAAALLYFYRQGGVVDQIYGPASTAGMRDFGIYINAAHDVAQGFNPYSLQTLAFRSGTFGVLIFSIFDNNQMSFVILQSLSLMGAIFFTYSFLKNRASKNQILAIAVTSLWFSCTREILSTGQITGIVMGLIGAGYTLMKSESKILQLTGSLAFAIVLDLKPHIFLLFIISVYVYHRKLRWLFFVGFHILVGHILINIYFRSFIEDDWIRTLLAVSDTKQNPGNTGSRTIWPIVREILNLESIPSLIPTFSFLFLGLFVIFRLHKFHSFSLLIASLLVPVVYSYFHLYSFLPIAVLILWILIKLEMPVFLGIVFSFLVISGGNLGIREALISLIIFAVFSFQLFHLFPVSKGFIWKMTSAFISLLSARFLLGLFHPSEHFLEILNINFLVLSAFVLILLSTRSKVAFENRNSV